MMTYVISSPYSGVRHILRHPHNPAGLPHNPAGLWSILVSAMSLLASWFHGNIEFYLGEGDRTAGWSSGHCPISTKPKIILGLLLIGRKNLSERTSHTSSPSVHPFSETRLTNIDLEYHKTSNKRLASNKSRPLIGAGCTVTLNLKNASNYIPLINACLQ